MELLLVVLVIVLEGFLAAEAFPLWLFDYDMSIPAEKTGNDTGKTETPAETDGNKTANEISEEEFVEIAELSEKIEKKHAEKAASEASPKVPQVEGTVVSSDNVKVKPFTPQAFEVSFPVFSAGMLIS